MHSEYDTVDASVPYTDWRELFDKDQREQIDTATQGTDCDSNMLIIARFVQLMDEMAADATRLDEALLQMRGKE